MLWPMQSCAQSEALTEAIEQANKLFQAERFQEAHPWLEKAIDLSEQEFGPNDPSIADLLIGLGDVYRQYGQYAEAEPLYKRALRIQEQTLGPDHIILNNLAVLYEDQGRYAEAEPLSKRALAIVQKALGPEHPDVAAILDNLALLYDKQGRYAEAEPLYKRALVISEKALGPDHPDVATSLNNLALLYDDQGRYAEAEPLYHRALAIWEKALGPEHPLVATTLGNLAVLYGNYAELATPRPLPLTYAQNLLAEDEALIAYAVGIDHTLLWVVLRGYAEVHRLDVGGEDLKTHVQGIRRTLDPYAKLQPFDTRLALELYQRLFAPAEPLLEGVNHVFVVPDGALHSLPFGVLVTDEVDADFSHSSGYRDVPWLARKYAITTLPSVSSLRALRRYAKISKTEEPFLGVGDPVLSDHPSTAPKIQPSGLFSLRGIGDVEAVRSLSSLPDTANELESLAHKLRASPDSLLLREEATEPKLRSVDLERYRVLAFATHAVVAGELKGLAEPALVLSPPEVATEADDGLLTANEVASLKVDADWVILSACNTAAPDGTPGYLQTFSSLPEHDRFAPESRRLFFDCPLQR
ncbi:MAG: CHAT domain-containing tetratricopeptide repeat protein [Gammaproteobacteria bacterium]